MPATHVAFLRGINVGGKNLIRMPVLQAHFESLGFSNVSTHLQSGNVLFSTRSRRLPDSFGLDVPVVIFSRLELQQIVEQNPFPQAAADPARLFVMFLRDTPAERQFDLLDPNRSLPDVYLVGTRHIYVHLSNSAADTKLTNVYFDSKLKTVSTGRNWRTVTTILDLMR